MSKYGNGIKKMTGCTNTKHYLIFLITNSIRKGKERKEGRKKERKKEKGEKLRQSNLYRKKERKERKKETIKQKEKS